jgi:hypothetical protein
MPLSTVIGQTELVLKTHPAASTARRSTPDEAAGFYFAKPINAAVATDRGSVRKAAVHLESWLLTR